MEGRRARAASERVRLTTPNLCARPGLSMKRSARTSAWHDMLVAALGGEDPAAMTCPRDGRAGLQVLCEVVLPDRGLEYCVIRCTHCSHGAWLSRVAPAPSLISRTPASEWPPTTFAE